MHLNHSTLLLCCGHQRGHRPCIYERGSHHLGRVYDSVLDHIHVHSLRSIIAQFLVLRFQKLAHYHGAFLARVLHNRSARQLNSLCNDLDADILIEVFTLQVLQSSARVK